MILITGGSGRLGSEIKKLWPNEYYPTRKQLDITKKIKKVKYDLIVHCAGYTNVAKAEDDNATCYKVNVAGTKNMVKTYKDTPFVFISSEYANNPVNFYSQTKLWAEKEVLKHPNHLIIRTLFKPDVWPYEDAYIDQFTMGDIVSIIAKLIVTEIIQWDRKSRLMYVGTGRKTIFDIAVKSKPDVKPCSIKKLNFIIPSDYI